MREHGAREGLSERCGERDPLLAVEYRALGNIEPENGSDWTHSRSRVIRIGTRHLPREKSAAVHVHAKCRVGDLFECAWDLGDNREHIVGVESTRNATAQDAERGIQLIEINGLTEPPEGERN